MSENGSSVEVSTRVPKDSQQRFDADADPGDESNDAAAIPTTNANIPSNRSTARRPIAGKLRE